jgi:osmotically-inducible protein OsmY
MKNDQDLKRDVELELLWEPSVNADRIGVTAKAGVIELDGHVRSYSEKWAAEKAALRVDEVRSIASEIKVELDAAGSRSDADIADAALSGIKWNTFIPNTVKVTVTNGWVSLSGVAEWQYQKNEAERSVGFLTGVKGVSNNITLKSAATPNEIKTKILEALKRSAAVDASHIKVEADEGSVTLTGKVGSWAERDEAVRATWAAPGVNTVEDLITVS